MSDVYAGRIASPVFDEDEYPMPGWVVRMCRQGQLVPALDNGAVCPYFYVLGDEGVALWVDALKPEHRECGGPRFRVDLFDTSTIFHEYLGSAIETEREGEILHYLQDHWEIR